MPLKPSSLERTVDPVRQPVTLTEVREHLRDPDHDQDGLIMRLIEGATNYVENYTRQRIVRQKWRIYFNGWSDDMSLLPERVREVAQIQYVDTDGATQTLGTSIYTVDVPGQRVLRAYGQTWPNLRNQKNAVWFDVWSGMYDSTSSPINYSEDVDEALKHAIMLMVSDMYHHTEVHYGPNGPTTKNSLLEMMLSTYRVWNG
jgi:uncharacterized phiE125 gp8 family phage protein